MTAIEILQHNQRLLSRRISKLEKQHREQTTWLTTKKVIERYGWSAKTLQRMRASGEIQADEYRKRKHSNTIEYSQLALTNLISKKG